MFLFAFHESLHPTVLWSRLFPLLFLILALINLKRMHLDEIREIAELRGRKIVYRQIKGKGVREKNLIVVGNGVSLQYFLVAKEKKTLPALKVSGKRTSSNKRKSNTLFTSIGRVAGTEI